MSPDKPIQPGLVESLNGRLRDQNEHLFSNLNEIGQIIEAWRIDYNTKRSYARLNGSHQLFAARPKPGQKTGTDSP